MFYMCMCLFTICYLIIINKLIAHSKHIAIITYKCTYTKHQRWILFTLKAITQFFSIDAQHWLTTANGSHPNSISWNKLVWGESFSNIVVIMCEFGCNVRYVRWRMQKAFNQSSIICNNITQNTNSNNITFKTYWVSK